MDKNNIIITKTEKWLFFLYFLKKHLNFWHCFIRSLRKGLHVVECVFPYTWKVLLRFPGNLFTGAQKKHSAAQYNPIALGWAGVSDVYLYFNGSGHLTGEKGNGIMLTSICITRVPSGSSDWGRIPQLYQSKETPMLYKKYKMFLSSLCNQFYAILIK